MKYYLLHTCYKICFVLLQPTQGPGINAFNNGEYTQPMRAPRPAAVAAAAAAVAAAAAIAAAADGEPDSKRRRI